MQCLLNRATGSRKLFATTFNLPLLYTIPLTGKFISKHTILPKRLHIYLKKECAINIPVAATFYLLYTECH